MFLKTQREDCMASFFKKTCASRVPQMEKQTSAVISVDMEKVLVADKASSNFRCCSCHKVTRP